MRRRDASIAANPILIGAATLLVTVVGVFLAYNANNGLPFVPTYDVKVLVPDAAELVRGNDVRVGGKRIGAITAIKPIKTGWTTASIATREDCKSAVVGLSMLRNRASIHRRPSIRW